VATDPVLKFFVVAITFYGMATFEGPLLSIKSVNALSHYTDWTIAHVHSGALGWNGFMAFGMMYFLLPRVFQTKLWSTKLANAHFWLATLGILVYIIPIYVAGITQGLMWRAMTDTGQLMYPDFVETIKAIWPMWALRVLGGACYLTGAILGGVNLYKTWKSRPATYEEPVQEAPALAANYDGDPAAPAPRLENVADLAKNFSVWSSFWWHRRWERLPFRFTAYTIGAVVVASMFELIPTFLIRANVPSIASVKPYTPLELIGRDLYVSDGCYNCHSQQIRPILAETRRYGEYSKAGEFVYDHPFQWGSRRIGPDLAREGGKQSNLWHYLHLMNPSDVTPGSIMPSYAWMARSKADFGSIPARLKAMRALGVPYSDADVTGGIDNAKAQAADIAAKIVAQGGPKGLEDKDVVAVIAYLQRIGTDLFAKPPAGPTTAPSTPAVTPTKTAAATTGTELKGAN
jgi:cytochrome c oxidase cbb3-type subunit I/II